jgi:hypothetical protein
MSVDLSTEDRTDHHDRQHPQFLYGAQKGGELNQFREHGHFLKRVYQGVGIMR